MTIVAIDPGPEKSAWVLYGGTLHAFGISANADLRQMLANRIAQVNGLAPDRVVIEKIANMGMAVGAETFETVYWSGIFAEACGVPVDRITRGAVKMHLCGTMRAKDSNIRQALIDRFGGSAATKKGGPLHGVSKDVWAALAVACTWWDTLRTERAA